MAEANDSDRTADENPYRAPRTTSSSQEIPTEDGGRRRNWGCLTLIVLALPLLDTFGMIVSNAGSHRFLLQGMGWVGFICGAALGAFVSVKIKHERWWSSCRWAIYGLLAMCVPPCLVLLILRWLGT